MRSLSLGLVALALIGCTDEGRGRRDSGTGTPGGETGAQCSDGIDNDNDGVRDCDEATCGSAPACFVDAGPRDGGFDTCDELPFEAETRFAPIDIVWIIDNSGSMDGEAAIIQNNMNSFVSAIEASGITDYRVVVITASGFVNVPPPLGTDAARFRFVSYDVQSQDAMSDLIASYPMWSDFLRRDAVTHIVHVTDDESSMGAAEFHTMFSGLLGHAWTSHAIASPPGSTNCGPFGCGGPFPIPLPGCSGPNGEAADNGDEYWDIATRTGGQRISICTADWSAAFSTLLASIAVPTAIPCEFDIPEAPDGMEFDRGRVNVVYTPSGGAEQRFPYVGTDDGANCPSSGADGWYYDDPENPTQIRLCPSTCSRVEADTSGRVDIALGCETLII
ncbi:hypothetical protein [Sandaracinus amylolyticus]|uniref:hypothetical protein n=1 Tax=Sandaracinus amylolyticus TaxID=927083 RepID=UPI001F289E0E|nr:hypothetical protein [Sandaracinus amylolyticus]UJR83517.1 Hypothetical protein I5071_55850 [Sandaracinus amylolyticus]